MDTDIDHYAVLGLPTGEKGAKLTEKEISKAYRSKALELHPDKRPDDPNAHANFQELRTSYEILKDEKARKLFDDLVRVKQEKLWRQTQQESKRHKMMSDLEERERRAYDSNPGFRAKAEEERITRKLQEEINRIRSMFTNVGPSSHNNDTTGGAQSTTPGMGSNSYKERVLKVSWNGGDYTAEKLRNVFVKYGDVEDVVIKNSKRKGSALVVTATRDAVVAATREGLRDVSNLRFIPLRPVQPAESSNLSSLGYQAFEHSVLEKMMKAALKQK